MLYALFVLILVINKDKGERLGLSFIGFNLIPIFTRSVLINAEISGSMPAFHGRLEID